MKKVFLYFLCSFMAVILYAQPKIQADSITVSQDGNGDFKTIQEAVNSVRDLYQKEVKIFIKRGIYSEKLIIPSWKTHISLIGESKQNTIITGNDYSGKPLKGGKDAYGNEKYSTYTSYTVLVQGNDFKAENLTIENTAGRVGQAVALHVEGDRTIIKNCNLLGNQDTLYTATGNSRQYYNNCYIEGTTDFIFGEATAIFQNCVIKSLTNSFITAAATTSSQKFGFVFFDCKLIADTAAIKVYLGRPWRPYAKTVFIGTEMGNHIRKEGWDPWTGDAMFREKEKTTFYAEYKSVGAGSDSNGRVQWSSQLTKKEAAKYSIENIFLSADKWIP